MDTKSLILSGSKHFCKIQDAVSNSSDSTLFSGSIEFNESSFFFFSFVNKESLCYILNKFKITEGAKVEIKKHDGNAERVQPQEDFISGL